MGVARRVLAVKVGGNKESIIHGNSDGAASGLRSFVCAKRGCRVGNNLEFAQTGCHLKM